MTPEEQKADALKATTEMMDRMVKCGWVRAAARTATIASLEFTPEGIIAIALLRRLLFDGDTMISGGHIAAFLAIVQKSDNKRQ